MKPLLAAMLLVACVEGQTLRHDQLAPGTFLVSPRKALDPNFSRTVVLVVQYDDDTTLGLIINQPSQVTMTKLFPERKSGGDDRVWAGGPVGRTGMLALLRSKTKPPDAKPVFDDIYLVADRKLFDKTVASSGKFRVYLGYSGWAPGQLENELSNDMWHLVPGEADAVFDPAPETVWPKFVRRTELRMAFGLEQPLRGWGVVSWKK